MLSLLNFDRGSIALFDEAMSATRYDLKRRIGVVPQQMAVFDTLTVRENIDYFCSLYVNDCATRRTMVEETIEFVDLGEFAKFRPKKLSGGLVRRLNIACGIAHRPELIFFDEPTVAVDPQSRNAILAGIERLRDEGATVVYTSHYMEEIEQICDRVMIMDHGRVLAQGTCDELKRGIKTGERIVVEIEGELPARELDRLRVLPHVLSVALEGRLLSVVCEASGHNPTDVLATHAERRVPRDHRPRAAGLGGGHVEHLQGHGEGGGADAEHRHLDARVPPRHDHDFQRHVQTASDPGDEPFGGGCRGLRRRLVG